MKSLLCRGIVASVAQFARLVCLVSCVFLTFATRVQAQHLSDYVNPLRGTDSQPGYSRGNTFPAATLPFGFNFWTPVTDGNSDNWLYAYGKTQIQGISVSHEPSPWIADHGTIQIMPMTGSLR